MTEVRPGQFVVVLSNGLRVERLPLGFAAGRWWAAFVLSGIDFDSYVHEPFGSLKRPLVWFEGPNGPVLTPSGGIGGGGNTQYARYELEADGLPWIRVHYLDAREIVATETIDLS